jgi:rhodanese-related sulfurtransferase
MDTWVIAYDDGGAGAARLWWLLRHFGHTQVSILDGGYPAWLTAGGTPESGEGRPSAPAQFHAQPLEGDAMDVEVLRQEMEGGSVHVLDARAPARWLGDIEPVDRVAGRIPGAINAPSRDQLQDRCFRTPEELRDYYTALGVLDGKPIVVSCGSGVSACVNLVAMELAGISGASFARARFRAGSRRACRYRLAPNEDSSAGDRSDGSRDALFGSHLYLHVCQLALFVDHEMAADVALLLAPHTVGFGNFVAFIDQ